MSLYLVLVGSLALTGCESDDGDDPVTPTTPTTPTTPPTTQSPDPVLPEDDDADGVLVAVSTVSYQNNPFLPEPIELTVGTGVAVFPATTGDFSSYTGAGTVSCNGDDLKKNQDNSYVFTPGLANTDGIDFSTGTVWAVGGEGAVPAFNASYNVWPSNPLLTSSKEIDRSTGYLFSIENVITDADSVMFNIYGGSGIIQKTFAPNTRTYTFTAQELSVLEATDFGFVQVVGYTVTSTTANSLKVYLVNETVLTEQVKIQ